MQASIDYIYSHRKFAKSSGHERISALLNALGNPENSFKFVHIVGTNGKGSVSTMISSCLVASGLTVGLFTSPFVTSFLERIQVNNTFINEEIFKLSVKKVKEKADELEKNGITLTFFEVLFAVALLCFKAAGCSVVVLEAGIGGEHDTTNVIPSPLVAVVTSISLDHTDVLGKTVQEISKEKCGVIKPNCSVAAFAKSHAKFDFVPLQPSSAYEILKAAENSNADVTFADIDLVENYQRNNFCQSFSYKGINATLKLIGDHQIANSILAIEAVLKLRKKGFDISNAAIEKGISSSFLPCRMEIIKYKNKTLILDGGHNPGCMNAIKAALETYFPHCKVGSLMAFMKDKDYETSISILAPKCNFVVLSSADDVRGAELSELEESAKKYCGDVLVKYDNISVFLKALEKNSDVLVLCGSFYMVSRLRHYILEENASEC